MSGHVLTNPSQLLLRNAAALPPGRLLAVNYPPDDLLVELAVQRPDLAITAFGYDFGVDAAARALAQAAGDIALAINFGATLPLPAQPYAGAILFLPKSRPLLEMTLVQIAPVLQMGASLFVVGENKAGIRSSQRSLERWIGPTRTLDRARHCVLFESVLAQTAAPFALDDWVNAFSFNCRGAAINVVTLPGVFSHGRLDAGTRLLLDTLDEPPQGPVLDWACGAGVIGAAVKRLWPETPIDLADVSALALAAAERTLTVNGLAARKLIATDIFSAVTEQYAPILANPPFHSGVATDHQMVMDFVRGAAHHLLPGGRLRTVVQRFVNIQSLIETHVGPCRVVAQDRSYVVYEGARTLDG